MPGFLIENLDKERQRARRARSASVNDSPDPSRRRRRASSAAAQRGEYEMLMVSPRPGDRASKSGYLMVPQWRGHDDDGDEPEDAEMEHYRQKIGGEATITTRQRSSSAAAGTSASGSRPKEFAEGLKRRFGSLRRK